MEKTHEERQYDMRRPYVGRGEHEAKVSALESRIADLEDELAIYRRKAQTRRCGW